MIRVGVNLCWLVPGVVGGSEQATVRTLDAVAARAPSNVELTLLTLDAFADAYPDLTARFETRTLPVSGGNKVVRVAAEHLWLPRATRRHGLDLLHDAGGTSPGTVAVDRVLTIHDIQPLEQPGNFPPLRVAYLEHALPRAARRAVRVVVPSGFVRDRVVDRLGVDPDRVSVVPWSRPPAGEVAPIDVVRGRWGLTGPYLVLPAITYPHKDHVTAIRAMGHLAKRHPDLRLVLVGGPGPAEGDVRAEIHRLGLRDRVVRTGRVSSATVHALLADAAALVFPSRYEGFGIPAIEAMAVGTPAVVSDAGSLPEVVGDAGVVVPAGHHEQFAVEIHRILTDEAHRDRLVAAGRARAADFDPERTAELLLAAYRSAAAGR